MLHTANWRIFLTWTGRSDMSPPQGVFKDIQTSTGWTIDGDVWAGRRVDVIASLSLDVADGLTGSTCSVELNDADDGDDDDYRDDDDDNDDYKDDDDDDDYRNDGDDDIDDDASLSYEYSVFSDNTYLGCGLH